MTGTWETEDEEVQTIPTPPKTEFKVKAYLVLVDSDGQDWGIIEDTLNNINWQPGEGEVVGTWSVSKLDNRIHISLATSLSALQDRSIQTFAHYAEERRLKKEGAKKTARKKKGKEVAEEQVVEGTLSVEEELKFNALRARLGRAK